MSKFEEKLLKQIKTYRAQIIHKIGNYVGLLTDEKLNFPSEDRCEYDKGYQQAIDDVLSRLDKVKDDE